MHVYIKSVFVSKLLVRNIEKKCCHHHPPPTPRTKSPGYVPVYVRVVRGLIDIVVVLHVPMSASWTPRLARAGSIPSCASVCV